MLHAFALSCIFFASTTNWTSLRQELIDVALGGLPSALEPDFVFPAGAKYDNATGGQYEGIGPNASALVWTISEGGLSLNATVFWSLNTSGTALANYPDDVLTGTGHSAGQRNDNGDCGPRHPPQRISETLVMYHNGHETHWIGKGNSEPVCVRGDGKISGVPTAANAQAMECWINYDTNLGWLNELGYDAMEFYMPLRGPNNNGTMGTQSHSWFEQYENKGVKTMAFFLRPVILAVNYAKHLGYKRIVLVGLSGGGWTTTVASAIDRRIDLSIPVAGSIPFAMRTQNKGDPFHDIGDYEQLQARPMYSVANYTAMYVLAGLEAERQQMQILHEEVRYRCSCKINLLSS